MKIVSIFEGPGIIAYLESRNLLKQYDKAKKYILSGYLKQVDFKLRQPKENAIYSFRINQQFRALCIFKENQLRIFNVDNHQK